LSDLPQYKDSTPIAHASRIMSWTYLEHPLASQSHQRLGLQRRPIVGGHFKTSAELSQKMKRFITVDEIYSTTC